MSKITAFQSGRWARFYRTVWTPFTRGQKRLLAHLEKSVRRGKPCIWACGRQVGKTELLARIAVHAVLTGRQILWVAPTHELASVGFQRMLQRARALPVFGSEFDDKGAAPYLLAFPPTGGWCKTFSAKNPSQLQGYTLDLVIVDEAASIPDLRTVLNQYIDPMLAVKNGTLLLASTPRGMGDFADLAKEYGYAHITTLEGGQVSRAYLERKREEYRRAGQEYLFRQEYLGEFLDTVGRFFEVEPIYGVPEWRGRTYTVAGIDWGYSSPFAVVLVETDNHSYLIKRTVYETGLSPERQASVIRSLGTQYCVVDPSLPRYVEEIWKQHGVAVKPALNDRVGGWNVIRTLLSEGRLYVDPAVNTALLQEWQQAEYDLRKPDDLDSDCVDHALDALRYALAEHYRPLPAPKPDMRSLGYWLGQGKRRLRGRYG